MVSSFSTYEAMLPGLIRYVLIFTSLQFSIFLGEAIQALGELLNIKWVNDGKVEIGAFCTTQGTSRFGWLIYDSKFNLPSILGVFKQLGQVPVSLSILVRLKALSLVE